MNFYQIFNWDFLLSMILALIAYYSFLFFSLWDNENSFFEIVYIFNILKKFLIYQNEEENEKNRNLKKKILNPLLTTFYTFLILTKTGQISPSFYFFKKIFFY